MDWWIVLGLVMIGIAIGLLAGFVWFAWYMTKDGGIFG